MHSPRTFLIVFGLIFSSETAIAAVGGGTRSVPAIAAAKRMHVVENDPDNPKGMQIRRARQEGEEWPEYFLEVYLWPYSSEHYNRVFTTLNQNGRKVQFVPDTIFVVDDRWYLVLRGEKAMVELMARNVVLENSAGSLRLKPVDTRVLRSPTDDTWIGFVSFAAPKEAVKQIMSSFALYGRAGGVAEVLDEESARRKFSVLRDLVEFIERIYQDDRRKSRP